MVWDVDIQGKKAFRFGVSGSGFGVWICRLGLESPGLAEQINHHLPLCHSHKTNIAPITRLGWGGHC